MKLPVFCFIAGLLLLSLDAAAQIKRSRSESMPGIAASNTIGFGDIWLYSRVSFDSRSDDRMVLEPYQAIGFGLSQNFSITAGAVPLEGGIKKLIGQADAHLKITLPGNDNLRIFGVALQGDLVFTTEQDTVSEGQDEDRPAFVPRPGVTVAADMDLIKAVKMLPLKLYLNWSMFDNERLLIQYHQQSLRAALEYKGPRHSVFVALRYGLYKQVVRERGESEGGYDEYHLAVVPGLRIRMLSRFSFTGQAVITVAAKQEVESEFYYERLGVRVGLEFPLFYRETNTEAVRAMIFLETRKGQEEKAAAAEERQKKAKTEALLFSAETAGESKAGLKKTLQQEDAILEREEKLKEKRRKIDEELKRIEAMLE